MNRRFLAGAIVAGLGLTPGLPALAEAEIAISGTYGNEAGCALAKDPNEVSEEVLVLERTSVSSYAAYCRFDAIVSSDAKQTIVEATCGDEGSEQEEKTRLTLMHLDGDRYTVRFDAGTEWGPLARCQ